MATQKQLKVARIISENPRKSVSAAMRQAGYSTRSSEKPQELTRSKGWAELMADALPDEKLLHVHKDLLEHPDWRAREAGLDRAYRLKGLYQADKLKVTSDYSEISDEELDNLITQNQPTIERYKKYKSNKNVNP